jgi:hypothetical protein
MSFKCDWCGDNKESTPKATTEDKQFCKVEHQVAFLTAIYTLWTAWFTIQNRPLGGKK